MNFAGSLEDKIAIRELHDTYADSGFRSDKQCWLECWAEDCLWVTPFGEVRGKTALDAQWDGVSRMFDALGFFTVLGAIAVNGDTATCRAYVREIFQAKDGPVQKIVGRYDDEVVREGSAWKFAARRYSVLIRESGE